MRSPSQLQQSGPVLAGKPVGASALGHSSFAAPMAIHLTSLCRPIWLKLDDLSLQAFPGRLLGPPSCPDNDISRGSCVTLQLGRGKPAANNCRCRRTASDQPQEADVTPGGRRGSGAWQRQQQAQRRRPHRRFTRSSCEIRHTLDVPPCPSSSSRFAFCPCPFVRHQLAVQQQFSGRR